MTKKMHAKERSSKVREKSRHLIPYRLKRKIITQPCRAGGESHNEVHFGFEDDVVAGLAFRGQDRYAAGLGVYRHVHEYVKAHGNPVGFNPEFAQGHRQVAKTPAMGFRVAVQLAEHVGAARGEQEIVPAYFVFDNFQHHVAPVGVQLVTPRQEYRSRIVDGPAGRQYFPLVVLVETDKVGNLLTLQVDDLQVLSFAQGEGHATPGGNYLLGCYGFFVNGHRHARSYFMPLY